MPSLCTINQLQLSKPESSHMVQNTCKTRLFLKINVLYKEIGDSTWHHMFCNFQKPTGRGHLHVEIYCTFSDAYVARGQTLPGLNQQKQQTLPQ